MTSRRNWFFHKRIAWVRSALSSASGLRLLTRAMPEPIKYIGVRSGNDVFICPPMDYVSRKLLSEGGWFFRETAHCLDAYRSRFGTKPSHFALEIGGHIGTQSIQIARSELFSSVIAIEPVPETFQLLRANVAINNCASTVIPVNVGIAEQSGTATLRRSENNIGATQIVTDLDQSSNEIQTLRVQSVSDLLEDRGIDADKIGLLWLDAEGMEPEIFASTLAAKAVPKMAVVEFSPHEYKPEARQNFLDQLCQVFTKVELLDANGLTPINWEDLHLIRRQADIVFTQT
jgi:FkbM family methyltransferase